MQSIIDKYEKLLLKPQPEPFKGYIEELLATVKGKETAIANKPRASKKIDGMVPDFKGEIYTPYEKGE